MRIAVTGGRDHWPTREEIGRFRQIWRDLGGTELLVGDCPTGVDLWALSAAVRHGIPHRVFCAAAEPKAAQLTNRKNLVFCADWRKHGRAAGPIRNGVMVKHDPNPAEALVVFIGNEGTANCAKQAIGAGLPCHYTFPQKVDSLARMEET